MSDFMTISLQQFAKELLADGVIVDAQVKMIRKRIYADGIIDKDEADFLFYINNAVSGANNHVSWGRLFIKALTDYVLMDEKSPGEIDADEATYIIKKIKGDGKIDEVELALLVNLVTKANKIPIKLQKFILESVKLEILEDGVIDKTEVAMVKKVIYGQGGSSGIDVSREEANFLFSLNDGTNGKKNDPSWKKLFVDAISKHVLEDEKSPGVIDSSEAKWLLAKIEGDGKIDVTVKALLMTLKKKAIKINVKLKEKMDILKI